MLRFVVMALFLLVSAAAFAEEPMYPEYIRNARNLIGKAEAKSLELNSFTDEIIIARNFIRDAESEYKKNLSGWSNKLDEKAEPTVRYFATMAEIQASIVLAKAGKVTQDKEHARLEQQLLEVKTKIKVIDDKNSEIAAIKKGISELNNELLALKQEKIQLTAKSSEQGSDVTAKSAALASAERNVASLTTERDSCVKALAASEKKAAQLEADLASLAAAKGAVESQSKEQIEALNRQKDFVAEVGKLGGVIKTGSDNMTVIFGRSIMIKAPKNDKLTADGEKAVQRIADLLKSYPEYRVKLKVHGFGTSKNEDASATDRMARMIREALMAKGKFDPAVVEALGAGAVEPIFPKNNPEGNRRVEVTFVKK